MSANLPIVFLSHAGEDADLALSLAADVQRDLASAGSPVRVFNTSSSHDRFCELHEFLSAGEAWDATPWETKLREYLEAAIIGSSVYLLLATPASVEKNSQWIKFEIDTACEVWERRGLLFIPCAADGLALHSLPPRANRFQGVCLPRFAERTESHRSYSKLIDIIGRHIAPGGFGSN